MLRGASLGFRAHSGVTALARQHIVAGSGASRRYPLNQTELEVSTFDSR